MSKSVNEKCSSASSSSQSKKIARVVAQTPIDAKLHTNFEELERHFDYSASIELNIASSASDVPSSRVTAYLQNIQKGSLIQPFGCLIAVNERTFSVIAYSENVSEILELAPIAVPDAEEQEAVTFGMDVRTLFRSSDVAILQKATHVGEIHLFNPILLHGKVSGKPLCAILHRVEAGLVIDLEPVNPTDMPSMSASGALSSFKLAAKAISRLQAISSGNISKLCNVLVKEVSYLTCYDRVMVYKFHEDEHGEVIAEYIRPDLEPYLGLHYPATDIPQAARFLFMKNKVRMICNCMASPVKVLQDENLDKPISLCGSTLRSPHRCHEQYMANMNSIASLVMSVTVNEEDEEMESTQNRPRRLWGLVVCHHTSPRFVSFSLRYACEFLIQVFGIQINKEVELEAQRREKHILQTQTLLCDMLVRDSPVAIITKSPNVMDLVKCDGAALYYRKKFWLLGLTPTEVQIRDIAEWLLDCHGKSTGLSTDSLMESGYPGASFTGSSVCGMAAIRITSKDFIFWFRSHIAKEIKWGGAKHGRHDKDDGRKMHPRSSFKAFLEVVKWRSLPWEDIEMDSIHSLQLILRGSLKEEMIDNSKVISGIQSLGARIQKADELHAVVSEMVRLIETAVVPILAVDVLGNINGWNSKAAELTGLPVEEALGLPLLDLVEDCSADVAKNMLSSCLQGVEEKNIEIKVRRFGDGEHRESLILVVNACCSRDMKENVVGGCFVGQDVSAKKEMMEKYSCLHDDYVGIMKNPSALIPPIFMADECGRCLEWNMAMQKFSGVKREEAIGRLVLGEIFTLDCFGCQVKDHGTFIKFQILLNTVVAGDGDDPTDKLSLAFFNQHGKYAEAVVCANRTTDAHGTTTGVLLFLQLMSPELQYALQVQEITENAAMNSLNKLAYVCCEVEKPLNGIKFMQTLMESSNLTQEQKQLLKASVSCQEQISSIVHDTDMQRIEESYMELKYGEFILGETVDVVRKQATMLSRERGVALIDDTLDEEASSLQLYGDKLRLQQVLSGFLTNSLLFAPTHEGSSVELRIVQRKGGIGTKMHVVRLEFQIIHPVPGIPDDIIQEMFNDAISMEGLRLYLSYKLVKMMHGTVQYLRAAHSSSFIISMEFPLITTL